MTNVWWRRGRTLYTPSLDLGILAGETRAALLELAPELGYEVEEGAYPAADLAGAEEAFTSSSVREVLPAVEVDGRALRRGPAADELAGGAASGRRRAGLERLGRYPPDMEKVRLGGMALANGVLVHGPTAWGCAIRLADGTVRIASGRKRRFAPRVEAPFVRGPLRLAEAFALLPELKKRLPEARFPFERPGVLARSRRELDARCSRAALEALHGSPRGDCRLRLARSRCPRPPRRRARGLSRSRARLDRKLRARRSCGKGARALRIPPRRTTAGHLCSRERARRAGPGALAHGRQARRDGRSGRSVGRGVRVDEPEPGEPAGPRPRAAGSRAPAPSFDPGALRGAARGCASSSRRLPRARRRMNAPARVRGTRLPPEIFDLPVEKMRDGYYTDAYFNHTRAALLADGKHPRVVMQVFQRRRALLGGMDEAIAVLKLCSRRLGGAHGSRPPRRRLGRAVGDRDDDRRRLHALRPSRDRLSRGRSHAGP